MRITLKKTTANPKESTADPKESAVRFRIIDSWGVLPERKPRLTLKRQRFASLHSWGYYPKENTVHPKESTANPKESAVRFPT